ncbi:MAG: trans-aconitate 2-methyltransferase [Lysobacter sp.]
MWDPGKYLDFADLRGRPFFDLTARIGAQRPRRVIDLGCGPGNLTKTLALRWPDAALEASDNSPEMVEAARKAGIAAELVDVREWTPKPDTDVVITNAVLQWVPEHRQLLERWVRELPPGAWIAFQVPGNFDAPSHVLTRELAASARWAESLRDVGLRDEAAIDTPKDYAERLAALGCSVDAWETTYVQRLSGDNAVLEWITGTALRPVKAALDEHDWQRFRAELAAMLDRAYPPRSDGTTWFEFRRIFAVARTPGV